MINKKIMGRMRNRDLQQRLRQNKREFYMNIKSQGNHQIGGISPQSKNISLKSKNSVYQNMNLKKRLKGMHGPSISFSKSKINLNKLIINFKEIDKRSHINRKSMDLNSESKSKSPFSSKMTRGEKYIDKKIKVHLKNSRLSREKYKLNT